MRERTEGEERRYICHLRPLSLSRAVSIPTCEGEYAVPEACLFEQRNSTLTAYRKGYAHVGGDDVLGLSVGGAWSSPHGRRQC
jgi:hypothetical protein